MTSRREGLADAVHRDLDTRPAEMVLSTGALPDAIFNRASFSSIAADARGVIEIFNVGAEWMPGD